MSAGNGGAAIGLANTNKRAVIGAQVADTVLPTAGVDYMGDNLSQYWVTNWLGEEVNPAFQVASCNGGAKVLQWVTNTASLTVPADGRVAVSGAGVATAAAGTGAFKTFVPAAVVIPANSFFWVETFP